MKYYFERSTSYSLSPKYYLVSFTGFCPIRRVLDHIRQNFRWVAPEYYSRALLGYSLHLITAGISFPFRTIEAVRYKKLLASHAFSQDPVFIIGHWRSGTTYLHQLLSQDRYFGYVSLFQTVANDLCFLGDRTIKPLLQKVIPHVRPMDNVAFDMNLPHEEEHAIARISPFSFYHHWCFPKLGREYFRKYVLFQDIPSETINEWKSIYLDVLTKASLKADNRQLLLKNPVNTARIPSLLSMFPQAKFIYIHRNPYHVFSSTKHLYKRTLEITQLQNITNEQIDDNILFYYEQLIKKYLHDRSLIPPENLIEIHYEDMDENPGKILQKIYDILQSSHYSSSLFQKYLHCQKKYQKNQHFLTEKAIDKVNRYWKFSFEQWQYAMR